MWKETQEVFDDVQETLYKSLRQQVVEETGLREQVADDIKDLRQSVAALEAAELRRSEEASRQERHRSACALLRDLLSWFQATFLQDPPPPRPLHAHRPRYTAFIASRMAFPHHSSLSAEEFPVSWPFVKPEYLGKFFYLLWDDSLRESSVLSEDKLKALKVTDFDDLPLDDALYDRDFLQFLLTKLQAPGVTLVSPPNFPTFLEKCGPCGGANLLRCRSCSAVCCEAAKGGCGRPPPQSSQFDQFCHCVNPRAPVPHKKNWRCSGPKCLREPLLFSPCCGAISCKRNVPRCHYPPILIRPVLIHSCSNCGEPGLLEK